MGLFMTFSMTTLNSDVMLCLVKISVAFLKIVMLSVIMLSVVVQSVVAPYSFAPCKKWRMHFENLLRLSYDHS
jgi:hypothetical protein